MKNYVVRSNEAYIFDSFERSTVSAILGPRRVGKTTLIDYYIEHNNSRKWIRLNMDVLSQRNRVAYEELALMIEQAALQKIGGKEKIWVSIDEAQKSPALFDQIKVIYDEQKGKDTIKFILTGSAHLNLHLLSAESLAGRVELLHLREFNIREIALLQNNSLTFPKHTALDFVINGENIEYIEQLHGEMQPFQQLLLNAVDSHMIWGGLPEVIEQTTEQLRLKYLGDYLQTYLEKDIRAIETIGDLNLFYNLLKISAELTGSIRNEKKIIDALHSSRTTIDKYRSYLVATLQYTEIYPYIMSSLKRLVQSPKGYVTNNGLVSYLTGLHDINLLKGTGKIGNHFENWFLNEIQTWLDVKSEQHSIFYWHTHAGAEVDFVISLGRHIIPFEVTFSSRVDIKKFNNLKLFLKDYKEANIGIICYIGPLSFDKENRILFLPAWLI